jgi:hypothetical protein
MSYITAKLCFFRNNHNPKEYFLRLYSESEALEKVDKFNHRNEHVDSGYPHFDCEIAAMIEIPDEVKPYREEYGEFIINNFGKRTREDEYLQQWGWFELDNIDNSEKWLNDFYDFQKQRKQELQKANGIGMQTTLF